MTVAIRCRNKVQKEKFQGLMRHWQYIEEKPSAREFEFLDHLLLLYSKKIYGKMMKNDKS